MENLPKHIWLCSKCQSKDIVVKAYINPNTIEKELSYDFVDEDEDDFAWCNNCDKNVNVLIYERLH